MTDKKQRSLDHPVHELIARRWSPYVFDARTVEASDLQSLFEAARWAPSSYNEQPWRFLVATKREPGEFARMLSCLVESNQVWARHAPVLILGVASLYFARNGKPNKAAFHDLGLAAANLSLEATARGIAVHQMRGIQADKAREMYEIPEGVEVLTALAIGYAGDPVGDLGERDRSPRSRKRLAEFVFSGKFGAPFPEDDVS